MSKFFQNSQRGEIHQLKAELASVQKEQQKVAVKKVIQSMTVGRDVSSLFADVTRLISTVHIDIKKLVYLYVMATAKSQPEKAVLLAGPFSRDAQHASPLIRGFAIRTMASVNVARMADALVGPLSSAVSDSDPYVRKTAAIAILKLFYISREKAESAGFLEKLEGMLGDSVATVVANAACAMTEINELRSGLRKGDADGVSYSSSGVLSLTPSVVHTLLNALQEAHEWGQAFLLDAIAAYTPSSRDEADTIAERVLPRLQHSNPAVVVAAVRLLVIYLSTWLAGPNKSEDDAAQASRIVGKIGPPLASLAGGGHPPEIRYVALRNFNVIQRLFPQPTGDLVKGFFAKYDDPICIKIEKLDLMVMFADMRNVDVVLSELKEYATEADVEFVRKAVRCVGATALKLEDAAQQCMDTLLEMIETKIQYVVQEAIVVIRDIFRRYPGRYEAIIGQLCEHLESLDEPDAKSSLIWILGQYADMIDEVEAIIDMFADTFAEEPLGVQLQLLTASVKAFLKSAEGNGGAPTDDAKALVLRVLDLATKTDAPDLRSRAFFYWRLLDADAAAATRVILNGEEADPEVSRLTIPQCRILVPFLGTIASLYQKQPALFLPDYCELDLDRTADGTLATRAVHGLDAVDADAEDDAVAADTAVAAAPAPAAGGDDLTDLIFGTAGVAPVALPAPSRDPNKDPLDFLDDLVGASPAAPAPAPAAPAAPAAGSAADILSSLDDAFSAPAPAPAAAPQRPVVLPRSQGHGLEVAAGFSRAPAGAPPGSLVMNLSITNVGAAPLGGLLVQANKNAFGVAPTAPNVQLAVDPIAPGATVEGRVLFTATTAVGPSRASAVEIAMKLPTTVVYFTVPFAAYLGTLVALPAGPFTAAWGMIGPETAAQGVVRAHPAVASGGVNAVVAALAPYQLVPATQRMEGGVNHVYFGATLPGERQAVLADIAPAGAEVSITVRGTQPQVVQFYREWLVSVLGAAVF